MNGVLPHFSSILGEGIRERRASSSLTSISCIYPFIHGASFSLHPTVCKSTARAAIQSLYDELALYPKPGLVSLIDNGSHDDMNAETFLRSLFALRHYFHRITQAGIDAASFDELKRLGIEAEDKMLKATRGVNTHRGAIFCLGLLCAAIGYCQAKGIPLSAKAIRATLLIEWGAALSGHTKATSSSSHGQKVAAMHAASGAREEAALGFPSVFEIALPALQNTLYRSGSWEQARIDALFALMAHVSDTNVYYRGGADGALTVKTKAQHFLSLGGSAHPSWRQHAIECHHLFVRKKLSPGGAADLLAAACLIHKVTSRAACSDKQVCLDNGGRHAGELHDRHLAMKQQF